MTKSQSNLANYEQGQYSGGQYNKKAKIFQTFRNLTLTSQNPPQCPHGQLGSKVRLDSMFIPASSSKNGGFMSAKSLVIIRSLV